MTARDQRVATTRAHVLGHRQHRGNDARAGVKDRGQMRVVEVEAMSEAAIDQRRMHRRQPPICAPDRGVARVVDVFQCLPQNAAPLQTGAVNRAAERIQDKKLEPLADN